jgi:hypothetical protein
MCLFLQKTKCCKDKSETDGIGYLSQKNENYQKRQEKE